MRLNLRALRAVNGMTQTDMAGELKTSVSRYSRIETGEAAFRPEEAEVVDPRGAEDHPEGLPEEDDPDRT